MAQYKGMPLVIVRQWLRAKEASVEQALLGALTPDEQQRYATVVATSWVPVAFATKIFVHAAPLLFASDVRPVRRLGQELAKENFKGVLRYVLRAISAETLVDKTAMLWRTFHDTGHASSLREGSHQVRFVVTGYPELPERMRESVVGWLLEAVEMTGVGNVRVIKSDEDKEAWSWVVNWR
jgi:hypothetical protein